MRTCCPNLLIALLAGSLLAAACGDDKPGKLSTGVDGTKPLSGTTPAEADAICKSTQTWARQAIAESKQRELSCRLTGIGLAAVGSLAGGGAMPNTAELQASCKTAYDQCVLAAMSASAGQSPPAMCSSFPPSCTATVAEYEACLNDMPPFVDQTLVSLPTCDKVNQLSLLVLATLPGTLPASCQTFQSKCGLGNVPGIPGIPMPPGGPAQP